MSKHVGVKSVQGSTVVIYTFTILIVHLLDIKKFPLCCYLQVGGS